MKTTVPSTTSSQSGRGSHLGGELDRLDGAVVVGTTQSSNPEDQSPRNRNSHTQRDLGEQPAIRPAGRDAARPPMGLRPRRGALFLDSRNAFGRTQHKAIRALEPGADRSLSHGDPKKGQPSRCRDGYRRYH